MKKLILVSFMIAISVSCSSSKSKNNDEPDNLSDPDIAADQDIDESDEVQPDETEADTVSDESIDEDIAITTDEQSDLDNEIHNDVENEDTEPDTGNDPDTGTEDDDLDLYDADSETDNDESVSDETDDESTDEDQDEDISTCLNSPDGTFCVKTGNRVPPTGQTKCYDAAAEVPCSSLTAGTPYFGQDAQYADNIRTFTVSGTIPDRTVYDSLTELTWQFDISSTEFLSWSSAKTFCEGIGPGWRLPTIKEITTTFNFNFSVPVCDTENCPSNAANFWTSTELAGDTSKAWSVYMYTGDINQRSKSETGYARCVKGNIFEPGGTIVTDSDTSEPVATDLSTELSWTKGFSFVDLPTALNNCETLNYGGHTDWRLPNINELLTVIDYSISGSATDLPDVNKNFSYWTSTTAPTNLNSVFTVSFSGGYSSRANKTNSWVYICVR